MIEFEQEEKIQDSPVVSIKVVGVGGAGGNTVNSIIDSGYHSITCLAVNTDAQALGISKADVKIQLGMKSTKGMGTGANPELGKRAAEEDLDKVMDALEGSDIVFLAGGMGGGTGSGALPVIARALKEQGILSIAVVTKPFEFEGKKRARVAEDAISLLKKEVDTLLVIPNQKLLEVTDKQTSMIDAFALINNVLSQSVKGISEIITYPGHINVDFADVRAIMKDMGMAVMGSGTATGEDRAAEAALQAISSPLLENMSIQGARGVLLNITGGTNLGLHEISEAASIIYEQAEEDANIILGSVIDESMGDEVTVTIIATGFTQKMAEDGLYDLKVKATVVAPEDKEIELLQDQQNNVSHAEQLSQDKQEAPTDNQCDHDYESEHKQDFEIKDKDKEKELDVDTKKEQGKADKASANLINLDDLDVPTFLRKSAKKDVNSQQS
ncbi:cell division protein FtsZ [Candidatus Dependentiae bacterium]